MSPAQGWTITHQIDVAAEGDEAAHWLAMVHAFAGPHGVGR